MSADDDAEIRNLLSRLTQMVDAGAPVDEYMGLWTEDCVWTSPLAGTWHGHQGHRDRQAKFAAAGIQGANAASIHLLTTVLVEVDGDLGNATSNWLFVRQVDGAPRIQDAGTYRDELVRTEAGWKMSSRTVTHTFGAWSPASES